MPRATFIVELDLDDDVTYEEDITSDVISATTFRGRGNDIDAADIGQATVVLNNATGKYSPKSELLTNFKNYKKIRIRTTAPSALPHFTGFITSIAPDSSHKKQRTVIKASDSMEIFDRVIISQRLMQDQPIGLILNRLIDASEGELVDNTSFDEDLTGYSDLGAATSTRETTKPMEGLAEMRTTGITGSSDGWDYSLTNASDGDAVRAAAYIRAYDAADVGKEGSLVLLDDGGVRSSRGFTLTTDWQRVLVGGTLASTNPKIRIRGSVITSIAAIATGAVHSILRKNEVPRNVDTGRTNLSYFGPYREEALAVMEKARDGELGGLFFVDGGGTAKFEERTSRLSGTVALGTVDEHFWKIDYSEEGDDLFSKIIFNHVLYDIGAPATYIWNLELPNSRQISIGGTALIRAPYGALAKSNTKPVGNTDFRVNTQADGGGRDMLGTVGEGSVVPLTWVPYGEGAEFKLVNNSTVDVAWITQLAERATPIRPSSDEQVQEYEPASPPALRSELEHSFEENDHPESVLNYAQFIGDHYETQRERVRITLRPRSAAILTQMLERKISDRVKIINDDKSYSIKMNGEYHIEGIKHKITKSGFLHETTWTLSPVHAFYWILGTGELDDAQALATTTAVAP